MNQDVRKRLAFGLVAAIIAIGLVTVRRHEIARFALQTAAGFATGYAVELGSQRIGFDRASLSNVRVSRGGLTMLQAKRVDVRYSLRDLLPGSTRRFGLVAVDVTGVKLTIVRFADGAYNVSAGPKPRGLPAAAVPVPVSSVPLRFTVRVRDASLDLREPNAYDVSAKNVVIRNIEADAAIDTAARTHYASRGAFDVKGRAEPFTIVGTIDAIRGFAMHRARAARFPLRALANYFADTPVVRIVKGRARNFDGRLYALDVQPNVTPAYHANLQLDIDGGALALASLASPIQAIHGRLQLVDNVFFLRHLHATLGGIALHLAGGIYDLTGSLTGRPQLRLGVYGNGDLAGLRSVFAFTRAQPVSGASSLGVLVEGDLDNPVIVANVGAAHALYRNLPFDHLQAGIVYHGGRVALMPLQARYAGTTVALRGTLLVGRHVQSSLAVHVAGPANGLPYLDEMLGKEPLLIDGVANGIDMAFRTRAALASARGVSRAAALIVMEPNGTAAVEPLWFHTERGRFDGGYRLDRPHGTSAFWGYATNLQMQASAGNAFPGLSLPRIPPVDARIAGMAVVGGGSGRNITIAGNLSAGHGDIAGVGFDRLSSNFAGSLAGAQISRLRASGPWGTFAGNGAFSSQAFVAAGDYRGTFEGLQPFLGKAIPGHGPVAGHAAIAVEPSRILIQGSNLAMSGATLRGIPISHASVTIGVESDRLRVYSAHAHAADGDVVAAGTFSLSGLSVKPNALSLVANRLDAAGLRGVGLPLESGTLWASGNLTAGAPLPSFSGGVTIARGRVAGVAISGNGNVRLAGQTAHLHRVIAALGTTYAGVDGDIGSLASGAPAYALDARIPAGSVAAALQSLRFPSYRTEGSFNARLRIGGRGNRPVVAGSIGVPAGDVNGLPFVDATAHLSADTGGVSAHKGRVRVATTIVHFDGALRKSDATIDVAAPSANLSDFDNFFDTGDTLDGRGTIAFEAALRGGALTSGADIDVRSFRYRNFPIGDTRAGWWSAGHVVAGSLLVGGSEGLLQAHGSIELAPGTDLQSTLVRSRYDVTGTVRNIDLSLWVAALGFQNVRVTGRASGNATIDGRFPLVDLRGSAEVDDGTIGPLPLNTVRLSLHSSGSRIAVENAELVTPGLSASASGSFGLRPSAPLNLQIHAATADLARVVHRLTGVHVPVSGSFESTLQIGGTFDAPTFVAGIDGSDVQAYGIPIVSLFGEVRLHGKTLMVSNAGATFAHGEATLAGALPLQLSPLRIGPADQPVNFDLDVVGLDPGVFDALAGHNAKLAGAVNGHLGLTGTMRAPIVVGHASLEKGSYVSDLERMPITSAVARLTFSRTSASIEQVSARVGAGTFQGSGRLQFPQGFETAGGLSFVGKGVAKRAQLSLPAYGTGTVDADLALTKTPSSPPLLSGKLFLSDATLPFSAFVGAAQPGIGGGLPLPTVAFDLHAVAGNNVRVRGSGYGAGLDIGVSGGVRLSGTLASPALAGKIASTGGTLTYFDRAFRVQQGDVSFDASDGVRPTIHAVATTNVVNPDPDRARNPYGTAEITISVEGQIDGLKIGFTTNPPGYSRDQIIGMIAPFGGFVNGIAFSNASAVAVQSPGGFTPLGALSPLPGGVYQQRNGTITVGQEAFNILNAQFAAGLLGPVENALGQGLGLSSVNLTLGYYGSVGFTATRVLGKTVSAIYATTFGLPQIQSFGVKFDPSAYTSATLSFFYQTGPTRLFEQPVTVIGSGNQLLLNQPLLGNSGFSFSLQRYLY